MRIDHPAPNLEPQLRKLWQLAFGDSEAFTALFFTSAYTTDHCRCITIGEQVAAALYWFDTECRGQKFAYLYAIATHPNYRRRGLCRALILDTHALLTRMGYDGALLVPSEEGLRRMYGAMGYQDCGGISEFRCAAGAPVPLRQVSTEEFACLRRKFLPEGGAIQEGGVLRYLATFAQFYAGAQFVLAAAPRDGELNGIELLGDCCAASGILGALGYETGTFRIPGDALPFAMFRPLSEDAIPPQYLGLALD